MRDMLKEGQQSHLVMVCRKMPEGGDLANLFGNAINVVMINDEDLEMGKIKRYRL